MKVLDLYKFVHDNEIEHHKDNQDESEVILFIDIHLLDRWNNLLGVSILDEDGVECVMKHGYFCFRMKEICEWYDIDIEEVFNFNNLN